METPQFKSDEEFFAWTFKKISESITNLATRLEKVEEGMGKIPPPGPDMVKYRIPGNTHYSNLKEIFGTIFQRFSDYKGDISDSEWRIGQRLDKVLEKQDSTLDENALHQMISVEVSDYLEGIEQRLNKIESKLGI